MRACRFACGLSLLCGWVCLGLVSPANAATPFTITATNVTMPAHGNGVTSYTVSGIPVKGSLVINCQYSGPTTTAHIPTCSYGPIVAIPVDAGQTVSGSVQFYPYGAAVPLAQSSAAQASAGLTLAGLLLLGLRRRARRFLLLVSVAALLLGGIPALTGCGNGWNGMTPGTYSYTVTAGNGSGLNNVMQGTSAIISVTIP